MHYPKAVRMLVILLMALCVCAASSPLWAQIKSVTADAVDLTAPPDSRADALLSYGLGFPFQVSATQAAVFCNVRLEGRPVTDFENGTDVVVFDNLAAVRAGKTVAVSRNERRTEPDAGERLVLKFPMIGGFVPRGALRADGTPHPHAGTGFGLCQAISVTTDANGDFSWGKPFGHRCEVHQLSYDGTQFKAVRSASGLEQSFPAVGVWQITAPGITTAIPDGDDLLIAVTGTDGSGQLTGVARWRRVDGVWQFVAFSPVTPPGEGWAEPSLVRDRDGALLFSARGSGGDDLSLVQVWRRQGDGPQWQLVVSTEDVRVWHKQATGPEWGLALKAPGAHNPGPISIGSAADGTPYIAANQPGSGRQTLCLWPLNADRMDLDKPLTIRAAREQFGPSPGGGEWMVDHPSGAVVRLADGRWHGVIAYRILANAEHKGAAPAPQTGCYVEEVVSTGPVVPPWRFE